MSVRQRALETLYSFRQFVNSEIPIQVTTETRGMVSDVIDSRLHSFNMNQCEGWRKSNRGRPTGAEELLFRFPT